MNDNILCSNEVNSIDSKSIVIILPTYNEELSIATVINDFYHELPDVPIWVIDNNSKDKTSKIALDTLQTLGARGGVIFEEKQGKSNAVKRAFAEIMADIYIMADADTTYPASEVHKLLAPILADKADIVVGDRHSSGEYASINERSFHGAGNKLVNTLINLLFRSKINDVMSGYRAMTRQFVDLYPIMKSGFELESEMTIHAISNEFRIQEVPIVFSRRPEGSDSKLNTFSDGFKVLKIIMLLFRNYKPFMFFSLCAAFFILLSFKSVDSIKSL